VGDELTSLNKAKISADWPEWEKAMQAELKQLHQMGTWELVDKPPDAVPILNKWVFIRKINKLSQILVEIREAAVIPMRAYLGNFNGLQMQPDLTLHMQSINLLSIPLILAFNMSAY